MVKIVHISDTHNFHKQIKLPQGDILIHTGDFCSGKGSLQQISEFNLWLDGLDFDEIVIIPGNHDMIVESNESLCRSMLSNYHMLINEEVIIRGLKFWGSPYTPNFNDWGYNLPRGEKLKAVWDLIPEDTDVLLSHGPPRHILDFTPHGNLNVGCDDLARRVIEVSPLISAFGHIHYSYGVNQMYHTYFVNSSICNEGYRPVNKPHIIEIDEVNKKVISVT